MIGKALWFFLPLFLAGCFTAEPAVSTPAQRALADTALNAAAVGIAIAVQRGSISEQDGQLAQQQLQTLRTRVADSAVAPIAWADLFNDVTAFAMTWAVYKTAPSAG